jgi:hypothetical protein
MQEMMRGGAIYGALAGGQRPCTQAALPAQMCHPHPPGIALRGASRFLFAAASAAGCNSRRGQDRLRAQRVKTREERGGWVGGEHTADGALCPNRKPLNPSSSWARWGREESPENTNAPPPLRGNQGQG